MSLLHPGLMEGTTRPDYKACVAISTNASLSEMIPPGALVMLTPVIVGTLFGVQVRLHIVNSSYIFMVLAASLCARQKTCPRHPRAVLD
jgi:inorganic pyrophosphatase